MSTRRNPIRNVRPKQNCLCKPFFFCSGVPNDFKITDPTLLVYLPKHCTFCTQHIYLHKKFIGSSIVEPYLIFVTCTTCGSCGEQICHVERLQISTHDILKWRNFKFPHMIDVKKSEFCPRVKKFQISPHDRCGEILNLSCFVAKSVL